MTERRARAPGRIRRLLDMLHYHSDTFALIPFRDPREVAEAAVPIVRSLLNCRLVALAAVDERGAPVLLAARGIARERSTAWSEESPALRGLKEWVEVPMVVRVAEAQADRRELARRLGLGEIFLAAPLVAVADEEEVHRERTIGLLVAAGPRDESELESELLALDIVASLVTGAITNSVTRSRVLAANESLRREVAERRRAETALRFFADASRILSESLDYEETLQTVARLTVQSLADYCLVDVIEDGETRRVAVAHRDPRFEGLLQKQSRYPTNLARGPLARVLRTGEPLLIAEVTDEVVESFARSSEHLEGIRTLGPRSIIAAPLSARGNLLGLIILASTRPDHRYDERAVALTMELARRAAMAVDNARLYGAALVASQAKSDFLAVMSHELRTPLNAIIGYADLLAAGIAGELSREQHRHLVRIGISSRHLLELIEEVLTFSRLETGKERPVVARTDLAGIIAEAAAMIEPLAQEKGLQFRVRGPDRPAIVETDARKLRQILLNLLSNAVKFTERGEIALEADVRGGEMVLVVRDTGIGIPQELTDKVFDPFWQIEHATTRIAPGAGLGLTVTRRLARLLGGDVEAESEPGKGSTFRVWLPAVAATAREAG